jgi:hypothetical protein
MNAALYNIRDRALKAVFGLKSCIKKSDISPILALKLFMQLIKPICTYGSEIWYLYGLKKFKLNKPWFLEENYDNNPVEKVFLGFCKNLLGVSRKSCNAAVRGEFGAYPLCIDIIVNSINFWQHLHDTDNKLLISARKTSEELHKNNKSSWHKHMHEMCHSIGRRVSVSFIPDKFFRNAVKTTLRHRYNDFWKLVLNKSSTQVGKLSTYRQVKTNFTCEDYISVVKNTNHRRALTALRISSHQLRIERGRYNRPVTPRNLRICQHCESDEIEDESHFLLSCIKYNDLRKTLFKSISDECNSFNDMSDEHKFKFMLSAGGKICIAVARFCSDAFELRGK